MKKKLMMIMLIGIIMYMGIPFNEVLANENYSEENSKFVFQELNYNLSREIMLEMKKSLDSTYEMMKDIKYQSKYEAFKGGLGLENKKLQDNYMKILIEKQNLKLADFKSNLEIEKIEQLDENKVLVHTLYNVELTYLENKKGYSYDEKHIFIIEKERNLEPKIILATDNFDNVVSKVKSNNFNELEKFIQLKSEDIKDKIENVDQFLTEINTDKNSFDETYIETRAYSPSNAVKYAKKWANGRNPQYTNYGDSDCTNFVSQALIAGGHTTTSIWKKDSPTFIAAWRMNNFLTIDAKRGYNEYNSTKIRLGDLVVWRNKYLDRWNHMGMITGYNNSQGLLYSAHSTNRLDYPVILGSANSNYDSTKYIKLYY